MPTGNPIAPDTTPVPGTRSTRKVLGLALAAIGVVGVAGLAFLSWRTGGHQQFGPPANRNVEHPAPERTKQRKRLPPPYASDSPAAANQPEVQQEAPATTEAERTAPTDEQPNPSMPPDEAADNRSVPITHPAGRNATSDESVTEESARDVPAARRKTAPDQGAQDVIDRWVSASMSGDIGNRLSLYDDTVRVFYRKENLTKAEVERELRNAYDRYSAFPTMRLTNISWVPLSPGVVQVRFDKEFSASKRDGGSYKGKVQSELTLTEASGEWKISGERDTKVYWTEGMP